MYIRSLVRAEDVLPNISVQQESFASNVNSAAYVHSKILFSTVLPPDGIFFCKGQSTVLDFFTFKFSSIHTSQKFNSAVNIRLAILIQQMTFSLIFTLR